MTDPQWILAVMAGWLACGLLSAGILFAYFQSNPMYACLAKQDYRRDMGMAWLFGLFFGPIGLLIIFCWSGFCEHGWRLK